MFILKAFVGVKNVPNDGDEELYNLLRNELDYYAKHYSLHSVWKSLQKMFYLNFPLKMCLLSYLYQKELFSLRICHFLKMNLFVSLV